MFKKSEKTAETATPKVKKDKSIERQIVTAIAVRVGVAVVAHFATEAAINAIDKKIQERKAAK